MPQSNYRFGLCPNYKIYVYVFHQKSTSITSITASNPVAMQRFSMIFGRSCYLHRQLSSCPAHPGLKPGATEILPIKVTPPFG